MVDESTATRPFDLLGPLPTGTTVLEASAGTGKTYTLAGLVTRMVAEGEARLEQMLLITFGRLASQELRDRVRAQLVEAEAALASPDDQLDDLGLLGHLARGSAEEVSGRRRRLRDALAGFDAATIATTHQFCQMVLRSLGVAGDTDSGVKLVEDLSDLVSEVVDDLYLARFADSEARPPISRSEAYALASRVVANPHARLLPEVPDQGSVAQARVEFAYAVLAELERRKRLLGILGYDDLLTRLAAALDDPDAPARHRMRATWSVVMVDEFQDTDPVQWEVISRAFHQHARLILIGDPKQAIYAFRGGDIETYLDAARDAEDRRTLDTNWRTDSALVDRLNVVLEGAELGHPEIVVRPVKAHHQGSRIAGVPSDSPFRLRIVDRALLDRSGTQTIPIDRLRDHIARDLAADLGELFAREEATFDGERVHPGNVAVIVESHKDARACREALTASGIPAVYSGDRGIFDSEAAEDWLRLLEAFDGPHRTGVVRAAATTAFFGHTAESLHEGGDELTDQVGEVLRTWADHLRLRGPAAVHEAAMSAGMGERVLRWRGGEREMTDLAHLAQLLHQSAHRERLGLAGLLEWLREERSGAGQTAQRSRRLDSDAAAVQIMTVWVSKGLQYPFVYLPFGFNRHIPDEDLLLFHDDGARSLQIGGRHAPGYSDHLQAWREEVAGENVRLTYVALTRAQSQVVAWWAPSWDEVNGGLSRLLRGRRQGAALVPMTLDKAPADAEVIDWLRRWERAGGATVERAVVREVPQTAAAGLPSGLHHRAFTRTVDPEWRRTSYSGLIRGAEHAAPIGVSSEPEEMGIDDEAPQSSEVSGVLGAAGEPADPNATIKPDWETPSPFEGLAAGAAFGSLVHTVLEEIDPHRGDLSTQLVERIDQHRHFWGVDVVADELAEALLPVMDTPLGPLVDDLSLRQIPVGDRLAELDFEIPLSGGDLARGTAGAQVTLAAFADLLRRYLPPGDPMREYADRLQEPGLGDEVLRGYLSGSIDAVLRVPAAKGRPARYVVVDYKTNRLGPIDRVNRIGDYGPQTMAEAMIHSDYPLQALLYSVVVHRFLRWRLPDYDPQEHLGGVAYLFLRGMAGPETPRTHGVPAGVFSWQVPAALVLALSDVLDGRLADQDGRS